jgi:hypothetical protein
MKRYVKNAMIEMLVVACGGLIAPIVMAAEKAAPAHPATPAASHAVTAPAAPHAAASPAAGHPTATSGAGAAKSTTAQAGATKAGVQPKTNMVSRPPTAGASAAGGTRSSASHGEPGKAGGPSPQAAASHGWASGGDHPAAAKDARGVEHGHSEVARGHEAGAEREAHAKVEERERHEGMHGERVGFHGRDYAHFNEHDRALWRAGRWHNEMHDGRMGWWYEADGVWYNYPRAIYPYPTYVAGPIVVQETVVAPPQVVVIPAPMPPQIVVVPPAVVVR